MVICSRCSPFFSKYNLKQHLNSLNTARTAAKKKRLGVLRGQSRHPECTRKLNKCVQKLYINSTVTGMAQLSEGNCLNQKSRKEDFPLRRDELMSVVVVCFFFFFLHFFPNHCFKLVILEGNDMFGRTGVRLK